MGDYSTTQRVRIMSTTQRNSSEIGRKNSLKNYKNVNKCLMVAIMFVVFVLSVLAVVGFLRGCLFSGGLCWVLI